MPTLDKHIEDIEVRNGKSSFLVKKVNVKEEKAVVPTESGTFTLHGKAYSYKANEPILIEEINDSVQKVMKVSCPEIEAVLGGPVMLKAQMTMKQFEELYDTIDVINSVIIAKRKPEMTYAMVMTGHAFSTQPGLNKFNHKAGDVLLESTAGHKKVISMAEFKKDYVQVPSLHLKRESANTFEK